MKRSLQPESHMPEPIQVFVSYSHVDGDWVRTLATNLHELGLEVFFDEWSIGPGEKWVGKLEQGLREARHGVLVLSPSSIASSWVEDEYHAMLRRANAGGFRLIPVLLEDVEVPTFLGNRQRVDFRKVDGELYLARVRKLADALQGVGGGPPARTGKLALPPGEGVRFEGAIQRTLRLGKDAVEIAGGKEIVRGQPAGLTHGDVQAIWQLEHVRRARVPAGSLRRTDGADADAAHAALHAQSLDVGRRLTAAFLGGEVGKALEGAITLAGSQNATLDLRLEIADDEVAGVPWETLCVPGSETAEPLALHPNVLLSRTASTPGPAPAVPIPRPLRILIAIGSPETQTDRGELLNIERELEIVLDATEDARRAGDAHVEILRRGSLAAIRQALQRNRYHVLHLSCHATRGELILEDARGQEDRATAERLCTEGLLLDRGVPLVVLSGCSTALDRTAVPADEEKRTPAEEALPSVARALLERGVPQVVAMHAPVSDHYAMELAGAFYRELALAAEATPLRALHAARQAVERDRCALAEQHPARELAEWATPALHVRGEPAPLFVADSEVERVALRPEPVFDPGVVVRRVEDFVGRRREERLALEAMRADGSPGVVLRGLGGVGKSSLAASVLNELAAASWQIATLSGPTTAETLLARLGAKLRNDRIAAGEPTDDMEARVLAALGEPKIPLSERFALLAEHVLAKRAIVLLLDNFEDNLDEQRQVREPLLRELLASWLDAPGRSRLLVTCRYPVALSGQNGGSLHPLHLGPLSPAETRNLMTRLQGLADLPPAEILSIYGRIGGHPRTLEYLDALLRCGDARFDDVRRRIDAALAKRPRIGNPDAWWREREDDLDASLAEAVTLAAEDVLLDDLVEIAKQVPQAWPLMRGASVYRRPVDELGLAWQIGTEEPRDESATPEIFQRLAERLKEAHGRGESPTLEDLLINDEERAEFAAAEAERTRPPITAPESLPGAFRHLLVLSLLNPVLRSDGNAVTFAVHRWTAEALTDRADAADWQEAHRRAAAYWTWRVNTRPGWQSIDIDELLEARHHWFAAGDSAEGVQATATICSKLDTWGAWEQESELCTETLGLVDPESHDAAAFQHQLGTVSQARGDYDAALAWYQKSLQILEQLGDRAGIASSYHQLGMVSQLRGDYDAALAWYQKSLQILEQLGDRAGIASSYHQLGTVSQ
ncbi:MAG: TIR domain-containing protein, partial [bacterium]|nr:TIR domain-containing protein [bacterium]